MNPPYGPPADADPDRTIAIPTPRRRAAAAPDPGTVTVATLARAAAPPIVRPPSGINPLVAAANPLLNLIPSLRSTAVLRDPGALRGELADGIRAFEARATASGLSDRKVIAARYLLCTVLDEVIAQAPWGESISGPDRTLLHEFHSESRGGEKVFGLLARLSDDPAANIDLLQLFHACFALGFEGRYAVSAEGRRELAAIVERLIELTAPARSVSGAAALSLRWAATPVESSAVLRVLPLWVMFALGGAALLAGYLVFNMRLNSASDAVFRRIHAVPKAVSLVPQPAAASVARLAAALQAELAAGQLEVRDEAQRSVITLPVDRLFVAGGAQFDERYLNVLGRIGQVLAATNGQVLVTGHTDSAQSNSVQFPSGWHLTREQARLVSVALARAGVSTERLRAEGRADVEPLADPRDANAASRARDRRIEVTLELPRPEVR